MWKARPGLLDRSYFVPLLLLAVAAEGCGFQMNSGWTVFSVSR
jgi:hypothetical protein